MIEIINNRIFLIDDKANLHEIKDGGLMPLYHSMEKLLGSVVIDESLVEDVEAIYSYIVEKIYLMPEYSKWSDTPFKEEPKRKLLIAFNKFFHEIAYMEWILKDAKDGGFSK
jgi:hypothetical protein